MRGLLVGPNVRLTAIRDVDLNALEGWFNNVQFMRCYDMVPALPKQLKDIRKLLDAFADSNERYIFALRELNTDGIIGIMGFDEIIWSHSVATLFMGIGDDRYSSKGFGKESLQLLLDFGFNELNFHRIQLQVIAYNEAAIHLYENQGFIKEGIYRDFILRDGKRYDMFLYSVLKQEYIGTER